MNGAVRTFVFVVDETCPMNGYGQDKLVLPKNAPCVVWLSDTYIWTLAGITATLDERFHCIAATQYIPAESEKLDT